MTRSFMLEQLSQEYVTTARAKGLTEPRVIWRQAFGNIAVPLLTVIALAYSLSDRRLGADGDRVRVAGHHSYLTGALLNADMNGTLCSARRS